jgi:hypothetical protein
MKITLLLPDAGRPIAYLPKLRKIAGSINATLLLCQLLYWSGREASQDGWIFKRSEIVAEDPAGVQNAFNQSIEFETGLSYKEQRSARQQLRARGLLRERYDRFRHVLLFQVDASALTVALDQAQEHLPKSQVAPAQRSSGICPSGSSLNGNYIDYTKTTTERPAATQTTPEGVEARTPSTPLEALQHPMLLIFQQACGRVPGTRDYAVVIDLMRHFHKEHAEKTAEFLRPFWLAWSSRRRSSDGNPYDPASLTWLSEWAMNGHIPPAYGGSHAETRGKRLNRPARLARQGGPSRPSATQGRPPSAADQAAARRINHRRRGEVSSVP